MLLPQTAVVLLSIIGLMVGGFVGVMTSKRRERGRATVACIAGLNPLLLFAECCKNEQTGKYNGWGIARFVLWIIAVGVMLIEYIEKLITYIPLYT